MHHHLPRRERLPAFLVFFFPLTGFARFFAFLAVPFDFGRG
jgi:hypothetical protein